MGGGRGVATSMEGKVATVEAVRGLLTDAAMIFAVPAGSLTVAQAQRLRLTLPEGTTARVVKNKLMARAVEGTPYEVAAGGGGGGDGTNDALKKKNSLLKGANMWFFIHEDIGASIKAYNAFIKVENKLETHGIVGGSMEGRVYDVAGVTAIGALPSKKELYAQIAGGIQAVPTKLARVIKAPSTKLGRAIKLATDEIHKA